MDLKIGDELLICLSGWDHAMKNTVKKIGVDGTPDFGHGPYQLHDNVFRANEEGLIKVRKKQIRSGLVLEKGDKILTWNEEKGLCEEMIHEHDGGFDSFRTAVIIDKGYRLIGKDRLIDEISNATRIAKHASSQVNEKDIAKYLKKKIDLMPRHVVGLALILRHHFTADGGGFDVFECPFAILRPDILDPKESFLYTELDGEVPGLKPGECDATESEFTIFENFDERGSKEEIIRAHSEYVVKNEERYQRKKRNAEELEKAIQENMAKDLDSWKIHEQINFSDGCIIASTLSKISIDMENLTKNALDSIKCHDSVFISYFRDNRGIFIKKLDKPTYNDSWE